MRSSNKQLKLILKGRCKIEQGFYKRGKDGNLNREDTLEGQRRHHGSKRPVRSESIRYHNSRADRVHWTKVDHALNRRNEEEYGFLCKDRIKTPLLTNVLEEVAADEQTLNILKGLV